MKNIEDIYGLSHMQMGILLDSISASDSTSYHQQLTFNISGQLDESLFKEAWKKLVNDYEVFRTSFHWEDIEKPVQVVHKEVELFWVSNDYSKMQEEEAEKGAKELIIVDRNSKFVLDKPVLARFYLTKIKNDSYNFILSYHHLLLDGWCLPIILGKVFDYYKDAITQKNHHYKKPEKYRSYIEWLQAQDLDSANNYWSMKLKGFYESNKLSSLPKNYDSNKYQYKEAEILLSASYSKTLVDLARQLRITPFTIVQGFWALALSKFTLSNDVVFGMTVAGRPDQLAGVGEMVGLFINTIPVRARIEGTYQIKDWLSELFAEHTESVKYFYASMGDIKKQSCTASAEPLFESIVVFENYPMGSISDHLLGVEVSDIELIERPKIPLALIVVPGSEFKFKIIFNENRFVQQYIKGCLESMICALVDFLENSTKTIAQLNWVGDNSQSILLSNQTYLPKKDVKNNIWSRFDHQLSLTPNNILVKEKDISYSYDQIANWANSIAEKLFNTGCGKGSIVGLCMESSVEMIASILAISKLGGTYVPLDPQSPSHKIDLVIKDCGAKIILSHHPLATKIKENLSFDCDIISIEEHSPSPEKFLHTSSVDINDNDIAYIIYTSGSTGSPKGVQISHLNLMSYIDWAIGYYVSGVTTFPLYSSIAFDLTVTSIYVPMFSGNAMVVYRGDDKSLLVQEIISDNQVDIIKLTPSHLKIIRSLGCISSRIRKMIVGGENLELNLADDVIRNFKNGLLIYNEYGPTEATVGCFIYLYEGAGVNGQSVPIGMPIDGMEGYVLDENLSLVPKGAKGELWLSGTGISPGYLNNNTLNSNSFLTLTIDGKSKRKYRTGDVVRMTEEGQLEFISRIDDQIKVQGHRVEMGELETILELHPDVDSAAVSLLVPKKKTWDLEDIYYCNHCGIQSNYPNITFDDHGVCSICISYKAIEEKANDYFKSFDELEKIFHEGQSNESRSYDCIMLLSGGKDSTYALYKLVKELKLNVLVFSMDNGFISEQAKSNMRKVCSALNVELLFGRTVAMNAIFKDSLTKYANVCQGCFKTIYTLSIQLAKEKNIPFIVTGLSRGQLFETRLHELYNAKIYDTSTIDDWTLKARKAYHRSPDAISENIDTKIFKNDEIFEEVKIIDFYRYCDTTLEDMYKFLTEFGEWVRPGDTGRSTNCLINDLGIYVHKKQKGYHNYSLPYSWDVRLGHKKREQAMEELDDEIDASKMQGLMNEIGYQFKDVSQKDEHLFAFYTSKRDIPSHELRSFLKKHLSSSVVPSGFVRLEKLPLTVNGKIDRKALRHESNATFLNRAYYVPPANQVEREIIEVWKQVLGVEDIGVMDNIFDIGGNSMAMTLIYNRLKSIINWPLSLVEMYECPTVSSLAAKIASMSAEADIVDYQPAGNMQRNAQATARKKARVDIENNG